LVGECERRIRLVPEPSCRIFTAPLGKRATTSSSPPSALTIFSSVEICLSVCFSILAMLGCLIPSVAATSRWLFPAAWRSSLTRSSPNSSLVRFAARSRVRFVVVRRTRLSNDLAILVSFALDLLLEHRQVFVVELVCLLDELLVKPPLTHSRLVATHEQNCRTCGVEGKGNSQHMILCASPQFLHVGMLGSIERVGVGTG